MEEWKDGRGEEVRGRLGDRNTTSNFKLQTFWNFEPFGTMSNSMLNSPEEL